MKILVPLFGLAILLSACSLEPKELLEEFNLDRLSRDGGPQTIALVGPDRQAVIVAIELADDPEERAAGLMNRESLPEDHGMLFLFEEPQILNFWMKDTLMPLDIFFFDAAGRVIGHDTMVPCEEDPCLRYTSSGPASIALEVNAGFRELHGIDGEWRIALPTGE